MWNSFLRSRLLWCISAALPLWNSWPSTSVYVCCCCFSVFITPGMCCMWLWLLRNCVYLLMWRNGSQQLFLSLRPVLYENWIPSCCVSWLPNRLCIFCRFDRSSLKPFLFRWGWSSAAHSPSETNFGGVSYTPTYSLSFLFLTHTHTHWHSPTSVIPLLQCWVTVCSNSMGVPHSFAWGIGASLFISIMPKCWISLLLRMLSAFM